MLTDSGGFQVFSLASLNQISERGVKFQSHIISPRFLSPESSMKSKIDWGQTLSYFDQCPPATATREVIAATNEQPVGSISMEAQREDQALFGIVQGAARRFTPPMLRNSPLVTYPAMLGFSVGEAPAVMVDLAAGHFDATQSETLPFDGGGDAP